MKGFWLFLCAAAMLLCYADCQAIEPEVPDLEKQTLSLQTIANARQLGGYIGFGGRRVKANALLRSGSLSTASKEELTVLKEKWGLCSVIDLRTDAEAAQDPDPAIPGVMYHAIPVMGEDSANQQVIVEIYRKYRNDPGRAYVEMVRNGALSDDLYTAFFASDESMAACRRFFDILLEGREGSVLWHCTGGKDRAGLAAVLVLGVLGVDEQTILADFALTNEANRARIEAVVSAAKLYTDDEAELEAVAALAGVSVSRMQKVFELARAESGSLLDFIRMKIQLSAREVERLRDLYLE